MRQGLVPRIILVTYLRCADAADLLAHQHELADQFETSCQDWRSGRIARHFRSTSTFLMIRPGSHAFGVSLTYVAINTVISVTVALPAAYAFNRYAFVGDKHLFFWLLTNLMAPAAIFAMPFFQLYYAIGLFDTIWAVALAHCLFNIPLAVWILEGFIGGVPREIDETAAIDGYSFPRFFIFIFLPLIANGVGVTAFFASCSHGWRNCWRQL